MKFDESIVGAKFTYYPLDGYSADWATSVWDSGTHGVPGRGDYFIATGSTIMIGDTVWVGTTAGVYISMDAYNWKKVWNYEPGYTSFRKYSASQAQSVIDKIINCNKQIISNNLLCARYADKFTKEQQQQIRDLQKRLMARNDMLLKDHYIKEDTIKTGYPEGYAELAPALEKLMNGEAIGIATWVVIVVACVVVASLSTAAYYAYRYFASEAEQDVKFSKELTAVLAQKLTPEEYQQLLNETKGIVTKARIKQAISSTGTTWASIALIAGGAFLMYKFLKR